MKYTFDPMAEKGHRLKSFTYPNGTAVKEETQLTVAMIDYFYVKSDAWPYSGAWPKHPCLLMVATC